MEKNYIVPYNCISLKECRISDNYGLGYRKTYSMRIDYDDLEGDMEEHRQHLKLILRNIASMCEKKMERKLVFTSISLNIRDQKFFSD